MITDEQLLSSPTVRMVLARMGNAGLHKTAGAYALGVDEVTLQTALKALGTKLAYQHLRRHRIASALTSYEELLEGAKTATMKIPARIAARMPAAGAMAHAAPEITHLVPAMGSHGGGWARGASAGEAALAKSMNLPTVALPEYLRHAPAPASLGTPMAREIPAAAASEGLRTKSRPSMSMSTEGLALPDYLGGSTPTHGLSLREMLGRGKQANIDLRQLAAASTKAPEAWRSVAALRAPVATEAPLAQQLLQHAAKPRMPVPSAQELASFSMRRASDASVLRSIPAARGTESALVTGLRDDAMPDAAGYADALKDMDFSLQNAA